MSFRKKLLVLFAATILLCVAVISGSVYNTLRRSFEQAYQDRANAVAAQFRSEFQRRGSDVVRKVESVAAGETVQHIALDMNRGATDASDYVTEARTLAAQHQLDFLELVDNRGTIVSSAQWQAKFGYPEAVIPQATAPEVPVLPAGAFLKREELPNGPTPGLFAIRAVPVGEQTLYVIGGERLDQRFLSTLDIPTGTRVLLYQNLDAKWNPKSLLDLNGPAAGADQTAPLIAKVRDTLQESQSMIQWTSDPADAEVFHAIPLTGPIFRAGEEDARNRSSANEQLMGVLLVGSSRRPLIELQRQIISTALLVGGIGVLVAVLASLWFAARVTRPVVSLANAARLVAAGDLGAKVDVESGDELGELAAAFNRMTEDLVQQKDRTLQAERVAAWRELARRLAHELKNPLFPLQLTVENLIRARQLPPDEFDEVFRESTNTLGMEIANLKTIIGRFSDFSRMPRPQLERIDANEALRRAAQLHFPAASSAAAENLNSESKIDCVLEATPSPLWIDADPELLHRALANLVLNAMDAMPDGGTLTLSTKSCEDEVEIRVSDTGEGMTPEECEPLFTPYYTTKQHGTGLGLAIVQSVIADHNGAIAVESRAGGGATFVITLPRADGIPSCPQQQIF